MPSADAISVALILKTRSHLSSSRDYSLSASRLEDALQFGQSLALFEYLSPGESAEAPSGSQGDISAAMSSVHKLSDELRSRRLDTSSYHERLLQFAAKLLYHHATHG